MVLICFGRVWTDSVEKVLSKKDSEKSTQHRIHNFSKVKKKIQIIMSLWMGYANRRRSASKGMTKVTKCTCLFFCRISFSSLWFFLKFHDNWLFEKFKRNVVAMILKNVNKNSKIN